MTAPTFVWHQASLLVQAGGGVGPSNCSRRLEDGCRKTTFPAQQIRKNVRHHPGGNPGAYQKSIALRCHLREVEFEWELAKETIYLPLGCLQGGFSLQQRLQQQAGGAAGAGCTCGGWAVPGRSRSSEGRGATCCRPRTLPTPAPPGWPGQRPRVVQPQRELPG